MSQPCSALIVLLLFLPSAWVLADSSGGQQVCFGDYVLCDAAHCDTSKPYKDGEPIDCYCNRPGPGLNIANSACDIRRDLSTYSLSNIDPAVGAPSKAWACTAKELAANGKGWTFCLDAPCRADSSHPGGWTCSCTYMDPNKNPATMYTFGLPHHAKAGSCKRDCNKTWSGATWSELLGGYSALAVMHTEHIELKFCGP